ncbi:MAG: hypothetical protein LBU80_06975 [Rikenellaceae bacterium]|nr:hypothetical protein [Rikenellaceae bacterium]
MKHIFAVAILAGGGLWTGAQERGTVIPRVAGLEGDSVYMALLVREHDLKTQEDSLVHVIADKRAAFAADTTDRARKSNEILQLETRIFGLRNRIGSVTAQTNTIEQEFILYNMAQGRPVATNTGTETTTTSGNGTAGDPNLKNLLDYPYVKHNLARPEMELLRKAQRDQPATDRLGERFSAVYQQIKQLVESYDTVSSPAEAQQLYDQWRRGAATIDSLENALDEVWNDSYGDRIYLYSYLLDKLYRTAVLDSLNREEQEIKRTQNIAAGGMMSPTFAAYPARLALVAAYEQALARQFGLPQALDSLGRVVARARELDYRMALIEVKEKEFIPFADPVQHDEAIYNSQTPIPTLEIPSEGTFYSVMIGIFANQPSMDTFRKVSPVYSLRLPDRRLCYFIGLYRTYGDAVDAAAKLKEWEFRRPEPVIWKNGEFSNMADAADQAQGLFRVEFSNTTGELSAQVKEVTDRYARHREVVRTGTTYSVGIFENRLQAQELSDALGKVADISSRVVEMEPTEPEN